MVGKELFGITRGKLSLMETRVWVAVASYQWLKAKPGLPSSVLGTTLTRECLGSLEVRWKEEGHVRHSIHTL